MSANKSGFEKSRYISHQNIYNIQRDSKRWNQFRTSIFPKLYMVYERST